MPRKDIPPELYAHIARNERKKNDRIVKSPSNNTPQNLQTIYPDMSTYDEKQQSIINLYKDRTIWKADNKYERVALPNDDMYLEYLLLDKRGKESVTIKGTNSAFHRSIESSFKYSDIYPDVVFAVTMHTKENQLDHDMPDVFCTAIIDNRKVKYNLGSTYKDELLGCATLFRFDSKGRPHQNYNLDGYRSNYFTEYADGPHFHFYNRSQTKNHLNENSECDAISVDNLIDYIVDLINADMGDGICQDNMDMPFLEIKKNPNLYFTDRTLLSKLIKSNVNFANQKKYAITKLTNKLYNTENLYNANSNMIFGLEAVLFDLCLMQFAMYGFEHYELSNGAKYLQKNMGQISSSNYRAIQYVKDKIDTWKDEPDNAIRIQSKMKPIEQLSLKNKNETIGLIFAEKIAMCDVAGLHSEMTREELLNDLEKKGYTAPKKLDDYYGLAKDDFEIER